MHINKYDNIQSILLIMLPFSLMPFVLTNAHIIPKYSTLILLIPISLLLFQKKNITIDFYKYIMILILLIQIIYSGFEAFQIPVFGKLISISGHILILFIYFVIVSIQNIEKLAKLYIYLILFISFFAMLSFILAAFGIVEPTIIFYRTSSEPIYQIFGSFTGVYFKLGTNYLIRPAGLFMEPGVLGIEILLALLLNKISFNSLKIEKYLIIGGIFTFSFGFYISLIIYGIFFFKRKQLISIGLFFLFGLFIYYIFSSHSAVLSTLNDLFFSRFQLTQDGSLSGMSSRESLNAQALEILAKNLYFGTILPIYQHASIIGFFAEHGIVGSIIYLFGLLWLFIVFLVLIFKTKYYSLLGIPVLIWINLYHRPFIFHIFYQLSVLLIYEFAVRNFLINKFQGEKS